jgi:hypothetical protein
LGAAAISLTVYSMLPWRVEHLLLKNKEDQ